MGVLHDVGVVLFWFAAFSLLCFWFIGFKIPAHCRVTIASGRLCQVKRAHVLLGCKRHRWWKTLAWLRYAGMTSWLDPLLCQLHVPIPSISPLEPPTVREPLNGEPGREGVGQGSVPSVFTSVASAVGTVRQDRSFVVAAWSLVFSIIQAVLAAVALAVAS